MLQSFDLFPIAGDHMSPERLVVHQQVVKAPGGLVMSTPLS